MQSRALRLFRRSVSRFQVLTERDFKIVAELTLLSENAEENAVDGGGADDGDGEKTDDGKEEKKQEKEGADEAADDERNPTPSLSSSSSSSTSHRRLSLGQSDSNGDDADGGSSGGTGTHPDKGEEEDGKAGENNPTSLPPTAVDVPGAAAILRILRATVLVLGGCGLGPLPSDKKLWEAVQPMLLDGSLRHRVRHFDRRVINEVRVGRGGAMRAVD